VFFLLWLAYTTIMKTESYFENFLQQAAVKAGFREQWSSGESCES
jgi:hypothetical protein